MSQNSLIIGNVSAPAARTAINNAYDTLKTLHSGTSAPSAPAPYMLWFDTTTSRLKIRDNSNADWVTIGYLDDANNDFHPVVGDWELTHSGTSLVFKYGSTNRMKLDSSGNLTVTGDIIAFGTI
jgi:hypothetical protein